MKHLYIILLSIVCLWPNLYGQTVRLEFGKDRYDYQYRPPLLVSIQMPPKKGINSGAIIICERSTNGIDWHYHGNILGIGRISPDMYNKATNAAPDRNPMQAIRLHVQKEIYLVTLWHREVDFKKLPMELMRVRILAQNDWLDQ